MAARSSSRRNFWWLPALALPGVLATTNALAQGAAPDAKPADPQRGALVPDAKPAAAAPASAPPAAAPAPAPSVPTPAATPAATPAPMTSTPAVAQPVSGVSPAVDPAADANELAKQGNERPSSDGSIPAKPNEAFSEDWWGRTRPVFEIHGYFRTRGELFHNFSLGRHSDATDGQYLWPQPLDNSYTTLAGSPRNLALCGDSHTDTCQDKTQSGANMRFRVAPELHISDNLRILSQIDLFDNLVLGSTPDAYAMKPNEATTGGNGTGYASAGYNGYAPLGAFTTTQGTPTAGVNGWQNSVSVKRAWAEYLTPIGQIAFGRMPNQWGLGMLANAGDGLDSDYQSTSDRIRFATGYKPLDLYVAGMWDFFNTGPTSASPYDVNGGQPYNTCNLCNVNQWGIAAFRKTNPEAQKLALAQGNFVVNGGVFTVYRSQYLDVKQGQTPITANTDPTSGTNSNLEARRAWAVIPDAWLQLLYKKFRFEAEGVMIYGAAQLPSVTAQQATKIQQFGLTTQMEYLAIEDKLHINFGFGWASGDPWVESLSPGSTGLQPERNGQGPISTFHFHPDYRVDLIFFRHILTRVEGAYYFRPSVDYDFLKNANGQKFGGGAAIIWSRASEFVQTPGHKRDLGVELDLQLYYQAKDGALNDDPSKVGGFFTMLQYGVFFPLGGLSYLPGQQTTATNNGVGTLDLSSAQTIRLFLGVAY